MRARTEMNALLAQLQEEAVPDVKTTFEALRDDLAATLADLAGDILLHREDTLRGLEKALASEPADAELREQLNSVRRPNWALIVEDFRRLARWLPRQRLARFGVADAVLFFRERLVGAIRPALVELERTGILPPGAAILSDDYWCAETMYELAIREEGFVYALTRAVQRQFRRDRDVLQPWLS